MPIPPVFGPTNPSPDTIAASSVKRFGSVIGLNPEKEQYYRELHADAWQGVLDRLSRSNVHNFSIYMAELEGTKYLFSYFEYTGSDYEADSKAIADDPETQGWWKETDPCQIQLSNRAPGANWSDMEMVFLAE